MRTFHKRKIIKGTIHGNPLLWVPGGSLRFRSGSGPTTKGGSSESESRANVTNRKTAREPPSAFSGSGPSPPQAFKVRTEGFGPSEDLVKGVIPHAHLFVEASGLHPRDYDVQRRVLELTMPSLAGVTIQPPEPSISQIGVSSVPFKVSANKGGTPVDPTKQRDVVEQVVPGLVPITGGLRMDVQQQLAQQAWEEHMVQVANTIIDQVEMKTGVQLEAFRGSQEEVHRSSTEVILQTVRQEMWRVADALRRVTLEQGEDWKQRSDRMVQEISQCIYQQIPSQSSQMLVESSNVRTSEKYHSTTTLVVDRIGEKVQHYFIELEKRLKDVAGEIKKINSSQTTRLDASPIVTLPSHSSGKSSYVGQENDDLIVVEHSSVDDQKMEEVHASIVAAIEHSAHQQLENVTSVLSNMFRDQQQAMESSTAAAVSAIASTVAAAAAASRTVREGGSAEGKNEDDDEEKPEEKPDNTALEEYIDGALRVAADEIRHSVVGEVRQIVNKFVRERKTEGVEKETKGNELTEKQWEVLASLEEKVDEVIAYSTTNTHLNASIEQLSAQVLDGQSKIRDATESVYALLHNQEKQLKALQTGIKEVRELASVAAAESTLISGTLGKDAPSSDLSSSDSKDALSSAEEDPPETSGEKKMLEAIELRFHQLSSKQEELQKLLEQAIKSIDTKELKSEMQLSDALRSISDSISSSLVEMTSIAASVAAASPPVAQRVDPGALESVAAEPQEGIAPTTIMREQLEKQNELASSIQLAQSSLQELEEGIQRITTQLEVYHAKVERYVLERDSAKAETLATVPEPSPASIPPSAIVGPTKEDIQQIVKEVMGYQVEQLARQVHAATVLTAREVADVVSQRNQEVHEQHLVSLASSLGDMVQASMAKVRAEALAQHIELKRLLDEQHKQHQILSNSPSSTPHNTADDTEEKQVKKGESSGGSPPALQSGTNEGIYNTIDVEEKIGSLHENLLAVVREEMEKPLDVELSPIYKYIDGILVLVREELSQHKSIHEQDLSSLKSSLQELHEKFTSLPLHQPQPSDHTELLSAIESKIEDGMTRQSTEVQELVQASKALMNEMKQEQFSSTTSNNASEANSNSEEAIERYLVSLASSSEVAATAAADAAASYTAKTIEASLRQVESNLLHDLPAAMRKEQGGVVEEVRSAVEALREETKASLESLQQSLVTLSMPAIRSTEEASPKTSSTAEESPLTLEKGQATLTSATDVTPSSEMHQDVSPAEVAALVVEGVQPLLDAERDVLTTAVSFAVQKEQQSVQEEVHKLVSKTEEQQVAVLEAIRRVEKGDSSVQNAVRHLTSLVQEAEEQKRYPVVISREILALRQQVEKAQAAQKEDAKVLQQALAAGLTSISLSIPSPSPPPTTPSPVILPQRVEDTLQQIVGQLRQQQQLLQDASTAASAAFSNANATQEAVASSISSSSAQAATYASAMSKRHLEMTSKLAEQSAALEAMQSSSEEMHEQLTEIMSKLSKMSGGKNVDNDDSSSLTVRKMLRDVFVRFSDLDRQTAKLQESQDFQEEQLHGLADVVRKQLVASSFSTGKGKEAELKEEEKVAIPVVPVSDVNLEVLRENLKKTEDAVMDSTRDSVREAAESLGTLTSKTIAEHMVPIRAALHSIEAQLTAHEASSGLSTPPSLPLEQTALEANVEEMKARIKQLSSEVEGLKEVITLSTQAQQKALQEAVMLASKEATAAAAATSPESSALRIEEEKHLTAEDHAAAIVTLEQTLTGRLHELKENLLKSYCDSQENQTADWSTSWNGVREDLQKSNSELLGAVKGSISSVSDSISSSQSYLESAIRATIKQEKDAMVAGLSAKMEQLLASQEKHIAVQNSESLKEETSKWVQMLPESVSKKVEKKVADEFSGFTTTLLAQLRKQEEAIASFSAKASERVTLSSQKEKEEKPTLMPSGDPTTPSASVVNAGAVAVSFSGSVNAALKSVVFLFLQTTFLCGAVLLCLYYVFAALLIIFVPHPALSHEMYYEDHYTNRQRPKRVADRVV